MSLHLHGVVSTDHPSWAGKVSRSAELDGLVWVEANGLAVIAREMDDEAELTENDAVQHLDVLIGLIQRGPVLPLRFGTIGPDVASVRSEVLGEAGADELAQRLAAVRDLVELRLTITLTDDMLQQLFTEDPDLRELAHSRQSAGEMGERIEFGRVVAERLAARRAALVASWIDALTEHVEASLSLASSDEGWEQVAFLVRRDRLPDMDAAVKDLSKRVGLQSDVEYVGPLPVYSFDTSDLGSQDTSGSSRSRWGW